MKIKENDFQKTRIIIDKTDPAAFKEIWVLDQSERLKLMELSNGNESFYNLLERLMIEEKVFVLNSDKMKIVSISLKGLPLVGYA